MISMTFTRAPIGEIDEPMANFLPELACEIVGNSLIFRVYGEESFGLKEEFDGKLIPFGFRGQQTYDEVRRRYLEKVGSVYAQVGLQREPNLSLEQTPDGWCVLRMGGAEYPHFDGLIERLKRHGFDAKPVCGRSGFDGVAIQITEGEELEAFCRLEPIITNTV